MEQNAVTRNIPTVLIIFGATGDLMSKKIIPALFHLHNKGKLPKLFKVIGFSRRPIDGDKFRTHIVEIIKHHKDTRISKEKLSEFLNFFSYQQGNFKEIKYYRDLSKVLGGIDGQWRVCSNKLFYLAVPPIYYETIFKRLAGSGLTIPCGPDEGWTRIIVEKPFGKNLKTAEKLDELLGRLFKEEQIYRIDHYLAKEMLQNILSFRFSNSLFEESWNNRFIEKIEIKLLEGIGVEHRGEFYDGLGALRDVGQNHLLQMLSLITMNHPVNFDAESVRIKRLELLQTLVTLSKQQIEKYTFRAQYDGYKNIKGVSKNSTTETYFKVISHLNSSRWQGVPIVFESGKRLPRNKEIIVTFKHPVPCLCPSNVSEHYRNKVIFSLEPQEGIRIVFWSKKPGLEFTMEKRTFYFLYRKQRKTTQYVEEYEKLLLDCIEGNQHLFLSTKEVEAMWKFIDPMLKGWRDNLVPLSNYKPDTSQVLIQSAEIEKTEISQQLSRQLAVVGLGKMGANVARRLMEKGWRVIGFNRTSTDTEMLAKEGLVPAFSLKELVDGLSSPRVIWLMLPAGKAVDEMLFGEQGLEKLLDHNDIVIDAGNSYYKDSARRSRRLVKKGIRFVDVGFSGGPSGARYGGSLMVGGSKKTYEYLLPLFLDLSASQGLAFFEGAGAGHFVKMIHNGIEYGMMQAIAEGFTILKNSRFHLDLTKVAQVYNHGSVIESRLTGWLKDGLELYGEDLVGVSGSVAHTGEGEWTVKTAKELDIKTKVIEDALQFRIDSEKNPSYTGKVLSTLRNMFGGHGVK